LRSGQRLATLALLALAGRASGTGMLVSPSQMGMAAKPGETASDVFRVSSSRTERTQVRVRVVDFDKGVDGVTFEANPPPARSCASWTRIEPMAFETAETGWTQVRVAVSVPADARGTYWALVVFQVDQAVAKTRGTTFVVRPQLEVPLLVTVEGTAEPAARIENLKGLLRPDGTVEASADVVNSGNTGSMPTGSWVVERRVGAATQAEELAEKEMAGFLLLPGHTIRVREVLAGAAAARGGSVRLYVRYGPDASQVAEASAPLDEEKPTSAKSLAPSR